MLWVKESVCCLQLHVDICSAGKLKASVSRTVPVGLFCKGNIHLHLKIKILIRRAFTAMPQVLFGISTVSDLSVPYRAYEPKNYFYQRNSSVLAPYEQKTASGDSSPLML